ncbi:hypothetical protein PILCRDRAFT_10863, partial [Piloderma croceum F 1598]
VKFNHDKSDNSPVEENRQWAVGLAPALTDRESWPPGGADLSFLLRTVIVDSLDEGRLEGDDRGEDGDVDEKGNLGGSGRNVVLEEAEWRLGFAIRDLPVGAGRDRWLNPTSIEALDFLFIDYKPPHPLNVLITPIILSKYQRLFAFILRMMRVEHVSKAFFRMTRKNTEPLFPTLTSSNRLLLHFRFITHSFVTSLSSHVFDTAIRGNFDAFLSRLTPGTSHSLEKGNEYGFSDVFALADAHSIILDNILSSCLLRSGQKAVGDLLRGVLELVLELGILAGDLKRGRLEEYQAAPLLEDLYATFRGKMSTLTKVLKALVDKGSTISRLQLEAAMREAGEGDSRRPPGGAESLYHLLIRLDLGECENYLAFQFVASSLRPSFKNPLLLQMTQPNFNFISGYESHDDWYQRLQSAYGGFRLNTGPPDETVAEGKAIGARELLAAEKEAADNIERPNETETEYFSRLVKRDATVRTELRAQGMKPPEGDT